MHSATAHLRPPQGYPPLSWLSPLLCTYPTLSVDFWVLHNRIVFQYMEVCLKCKACVLFAGLLLMASRWCARQAIALYGSERQGKRLQLPRHRTPATTATRRMRAHTPCMIGG